MINVFLFVAVAAILHSAASLGIIPRFVLEPIEDLLRTIRYGFSLDWVPEPRMIYPEIWKWGTIIASTFVFLTVFVQISLNFGECQQLWRRYRERLNWKIRRSSAPPTHVDEDDSFRGLMKQFRQVIFNHWWKEALFVNFIYYLIVGIAWAAISFWTNHWDINWYMILLENNYQLFFHHLSVWWPFFITLGLVWFSIVIGRELYEWYLIKNQLFAKRQRQNTAQQKATTTREESTPAIHRPGMDQTTPPITNSPSSPAPEQ